MGRDQRADLGGSLRTASARRSRRASASRTCTSWTRSQAPITAHRIAVRVVTESPWHALFAKTLFIDPTAGELEHFEPDALVLHAPSVSASPDEDGTRTSTFVVLHPSRLEVVIGGTYYAGRDQEVDLHAHERPSPASGRSSHALLCERGRGRSRRGVLRALRDREDDALGRPSAPPRRRRRARLERRRDLQHRRRLLREGDQALREGRAPDLPDDPNLRHRARERRRRRAGRPRPRRRLEDREHARRLQARADRATRCQSSGPGIRPRSSSSLPTRSGSSRRSRG